MEVGMGEPSTATGSMLIDLLCGMFLFISPASILGLVGLFILCCSVLSGALAWSTS